MGAMRSMLLRLAGALGLKTMFRAVRSRNFRLFLGGQGVSLVGTWIQHTAMSWLVYRLTNSVFLLGAVAFSSQIPCFVFAPLAGALADRYNRHRVLLVTQVISMLQAFALAALVLTGTVRVWHVMALGFLLGCVNSLDMPARHSFVLDMVKKNELLGYAIALNSLLSNVARLIGPSVAGVLIAVTGEGICFLLNGLSFLAVIWSLLAMRLDPPRPRARPAPLVREMGEGLAYVFGFPPIRLILALLCVSSIMGLSYVVLMPVFARDILHGGPRTLGILMAAGGVGAMVGTLYLAAKKSVYGLGRMLPEAASIFGLGLIAFSLSRALWLSLLVLVVSGFGMMVQLASSNTILQVVVDDDKRGRVMSFYSMSLIGMAPIGSLLIGTLASRIGAPLTLSIAGGAIVAAACVFATRLREFRGMLHPLYRRAGVIPEVAAALQTATELTSPPEE